MVHLGRGSHLYCSVKALCCATAPDCLLSLITERPPHRSRRALLTHRAPPSGQTSAGRGLKPLALRRTAANRIDVVARLSVRTTAACRLFPLGEALPSTTSARSCLPLFGRFVGTTTSSDFSSAFMLGVRLVPSRAGPAQVRARVRPPRFRAKNFPTCARSPTARGSSHASHYVMGDVAFSSAERDRHPGSRPVSQLNPWPVVSPVNASRRPSRDAAHHSGSGWLARPSPWGTFTSYSLPAFPGALRSGSKREELAIGLFRKLSRFLE